MDEWESILAVVASLIALGITIFIFIDGQRGDREGTLWGTISSIGVVLTIPLLLSQLYEPFAASLSTPEALLVLRILAALGGLMAVAAAIGYAASGQRRVCPRCGLPQDPSWAFCPNCVRTETPPPPPPTPVKPTELRDKRPRTVAWLVVQDGQEAGRQVQLKSSTFVGRDPDKCDVVFKDNQVSGQHARIRLEQGQFYIYDLGSTNHVYVNGHRVDRQLLVDGDKIVLGSITLVFKKA